ncbi:hypothetical protein TrVE_jg13084 [Triparma verrucosa]|uniref:BspA family leucine-rich repeat surface protein n=1 Tax=Triparma verrucosa TaxID=1606542 RepID=A0A9W7EQQ9_9STRA|nr:hypothetical protein TrVE_jg13084 [Triparma verrucosa]
MDDIEMGVKQGQSVNPLRAKKAPRGQKKARGAAKSENSVKNFEDTANRSLEGNSEAVAHRGKSASDAIQMSRNTTQGGFLYGSGSLQEMLAISISFLQTFSLIILLDVTWPPWFLHYFSWMEMLILDFEFGDKWVVIICGLAIIPIFVLEADHGLFRGRHFFGIQRRLFERKDYESVKRFVGEDDEWKKIRSANFHDIKLFTFGFTLFLCLKAVSEGHLGVAWWIEGGGVLGYSAIENFTLKRVFWEHFAFLFIYTIIFLPGINSCIEIAKIGATNMGFSGSSCESCTKTPRVLILGVVLGCVYSVAPLWLLWRTAKTVKASFARGDNYLPELEAILGKSQEEADRAPEDSELDVATSDSYKAAVVGVVLGSFKEQFWWWKIWLLAERATIAVAVLTEGDTIAVSVIVLLGWLACFLARPYWIVAENRVDIISRTCTLFTAISANFVSEGTFWLDMSLCVCGALTMLILVQSIGPFRVFRGAAEWWRRRVRWKKIMRNGDAADLSEADIAEISEKEFMKFPLAVKSALSEGNERFHPMLKAELNVDGIEDYEKLVKCAAEIEKSEGDVLISLVSKAIVVEGGKITSIDWSSDEKFTGTLPTSFKDFTDLSEIKLGDQTFAGSSFSFNSETLKEAVNLWCSNSKGAEKKYGHIRNWDVSGVESMENLFSCDWSGPGEAGKTFNEDISKWNVSNVKSMQNMFFKAKSFDCDISSWNVSNVENMQHMFYRALKFNADISSWDTGAVTNMSGMFEDAISFGQDVSGWNIDNVRDLRWIFKGASNFNRIEVKKKWNLEGKKADKLFG